MGLGFSLAIATDKQIRSKSDEEWVRYFAGIRNRRVRIGQMTVAGGRFKDLGELARWQSIARRIAKLV